jgi:hypothetical protein
LTDVIPLADNTADLVDFSDHPLLGNQNDCFIIRRSRPKNSLLAEHYSLLTNRKVGEITLLDTVRTFPRMYFGPISEQFSSREEYNRSADFDIRSLPDGRYVLAWSQLLQSGKWANFVSLLDENFSWQGYVKRLNTDTTIDAIHPILSTSGNFVCAAWLQKNNNRYEFDVYFRRFAADELLGTEWSNPVSSFAITSIYPQPAGERVTIAYTLAPELSREEETEITVYDFLGRSVWRQTNTVTGSSGSASISMQRCPAGAYRAVVRQGRECRFANFLVIK